MKILLRSEIESDRALLEQRVDAFVRQLSDFVPIEVLESSVANSGSSADF